MRKTALTLVTACIAGTALASGPATADEPTWDNHRSLSCDGQTVDAEFTPGGVFTTFHVVGSNDVIIAKHLEILGYFDEGEWTTTRHVPGFTANAKETVHCEYVDEKNFSVRFEGLRR